MKEKVLFAREEIAQRVSELGKALSEEYKDAKPLVIPLLRGGFIFAADLIREMDCELEIDFMTTSSYEHEEVSSGNVKVFKQLRTEVAGKDVLIVDDIIDTGHTLSKVKSILEEMGANSVKTCVMLDKPERRVVDIEPDFYGFKIPDLFIVGYGLNYGDYKRNVPYIYAYVQE